MNASTYHATSSDFDGIGDSISIVMRGNSQRGSALCCLMCTEEFVPGAERGMLDCGHMEFCYQCIQHWADMSNKCPFCSARFHTVTKCVQTESGLQETLEKLQVADKDQKKIDPALNAFLERLKCVKCRSGEQEESMLLCDKCNLGFHTFCLGLEHIPLLEVWFCETCIREMTASVQRRQGKQMKLARKPVRVRVSRKNRSPIRATEPDFAYCDPEFDSVAKALEYH